MSIELFRVLQSYNQGTWQTQHHLQTSATKRTLLRSMDASLVANEISLPGSYHDSSSLSRPEVEPTMRLADVLNGPEQFNFHQSFGVMTGRRLQRRYQGVYQRYSFMTQLVTWLVIITIVVFVILAANESGTAQIPYDTYIFWITLFTIAAASNSNLMSQSINFWYFAVIVVVLYILVQLTLIVRWIIYWIILAESLTYAITGNLFVMYWIDNHEVTDSDKQVRFVMIIILSSVEVITVMAYWLTHYVYPWLVLRQKFDLVNWWNIKAGDETNTLTYLSKARFYTRKRSVIKYCGGLNALGQPHGYGMWTDTSYHGERLTGQWENGNPIGPFRSFEHGSGYSFVNIRVGFCHNRAEKSSSKVYFFPKHSENGLNWGVASVECSVSGGFFKYLPAVTHLTPSDENKAPKNAAECLSVLRTPTDGVVFNHKDDKAMDLNQHCDERATRRHLFREKSSPVLHLSNNDERKEALILLHGYSCALDYGIQRLAQLLALGDFPSYIHPFVFSWPSGGVLAFFQAKEVGSEGERTAHDFILFLQSLIDAGYTKLNIIAHSMGARVFFSSLNKGLFDRVFLPAESDVNADVTPKRMRLSTLTLCNPDYDRNEFVKYGGSYDRARYFCNHFTLYADSLDGALFYSEFLLKKSITGPLNYSLGRRGHMIHRDLEDDKPTERSDSLFPDLQHKDLSPPQDLDLAFAAVNRRANYPGLTLFAYNRSRTQLIDNGSAPYGMTRSTTFKEDTPAHYLDMDVIDTTWMDNNVHAIRHNYFNLNPTIVDDLRHLIVLKKRAGSRPGLLKTTSAENVYIFLVAPSHVKNK
ncbi:putative alpha/Beta hydrolase [Plasmopara halstedii]